MTAEEGRKGTREFQSYRQFCRLQPGTNRVIMVTLGCDRETHVIAKDVGSHNGEETTFLEPTSVRAVGPCGGSCGASRLVAIIRVSDYYKCSGF